MDSQIFEEKVVLQNLQHYLPHQNPLKDFVHHNTLNSFQNLPFHEALETASSYFGYKTYLQLKEYRALYAQNKINHAILDRIICEAKGKENLAEWKKKLIEEHYDTAWRNRLGYLHHSWDRAYQLNIEKEVHTFLFRLVGSYVDQGISMEKFPTESSSFLEAIKILEANSFLVKIFQSKRVRHLLLHTECSITSLLDILVGDQSLYEQYLFDQQFAHAGWSGMVAVLEHHHETLLDERQISLEDFIIFELLLEIDALDRKFGEKGWTSLNNHIKTVITPIFAPIVKRPLFEVYAFWQEAYEWTLYDQVLSGLQQVPKDKNLSKESKYDFQAIFCIDDRECSFRRYVEQFGNTQTFGTAGFFNLEFYFQPENGKFFTKSCPAPVNPKYLIKETKAKQHHHKHDAHFSRISRNLLGGWLVSQTIGFWSAIQLAWNIFKPSETPALVSSFRHMDHDSVLQFECKSLNAPKDHDLQIGFTIDEMINRLEALLKSIGLTKNFSDLVYLIGHGASSVNNTHYAGYDCGACSGRAGSVNARIGAAMANKPEVREGLAKKGIEIPETTQFLGALHDTTRDEIDFYDENILSESNNILHKKNKEIFKKSLAYNAKERSRRFALIDSHQSAEKVHEEVKLRALSLFEPRPEWNHASNAMCIVGRRETNKHLFLDRRSFLNSYDYAQDLEGKYLLGILQAVAPVCGGINLEYYFSKVDNQRLGAGSKLPHNVIGLIGVANGLDGDLRTGLPLQMLNIHDTLRLLVVVEHFPAVVLQTIKKNPATYQWFANYWVHLVVIDPETTKLYRFTNENQNAQWIDYEPITKKIPSVKNIEEVFENTSENLPIYLFK
ncbi:MAG: DUF2309 domain-containing protein [Bacteroidetes bacterium]|nr:MAG: DUF2309 domain-containing protein [Bacteroidota bacterium]